MITSKGLRRSGAAICRGQQRLTVSPRGARFYSFLSARTSALRNRPTSSWQRTVYAPSVGQLRSISLWGWGSSARDADFAKVHNPESSVVPEKSPGHDGQILTQQITPSSQSIPAVHQTSSIPPPSSLSSVAEPTPSPVTSSSLGQLTPTPGDSTPVDAVDPADAFSAVFERIGYLKEVCGIDFGWGSSSMMEMILEYIHIYGGVPWAASIALLAVFSRLAIFYPITLASDMSAKLGATRSLLGPVQERMRAAMRASDYKTLAEAKAELKALKKAYDIKVSRVIVPVLIQVPLQFGAFRLLRNMAELPVPALLKENWLWTQDLTLSDPFYVIPITSAAIIYLTIKRGGEMGTSQIPSGLMRFMSYIAPFFSFIFMSFQPGAVQVYFFVSSLMALGQSRLISSNSFRRFMGMHPITIKPKDPTPDASSTSMSARSSKSTSTSTGTPTFGPGGLRLYRLTSTVPSKNPSNDVSLIDKAVNTVKSRKNEVAEGLYSLMGTTKEKKVKETLQDKEMRRAEEYEKRMAREDEWRRSERNRKGGGRRRMEA